MEQNLTYAFLLTLIAGLSTGIGSFIALLAKRTNARFLSFSLGLSAGVMIYVSFVDIFPKAQDLLCDSFDDRMASIYAALSFFGGIGLIALIDKLVPSVENPHEMVNIATLSEVDHNQSFRERKMMRMGLMTALVIGIHNFPEGLATFIAALEDPQIGVAIAGAIAIHNIPEGIAVAIPIFIATGSRRRAFFSSFLSGLAEPIGAVVGYMILMPFMSDTLLGVVFGGVAGIMVYISLDELLPAAQQWGEHHISIWGLIVGMAIMASGVIILS
ncbi:MAG: zinc transporter ZupT [Rikenellaceae bacterium]